MDIAIAADSGSSQDVGMGQPDESLLAHLEAQAVHLLALTRRAASRPGEVALLTDVRNEVFTLRETLGELGDPLALASNEDWSCESEARDGSAASASRKAAGPWGAAAADSFVELAEKDGLVLVLTGVLSGKERVELHAELREDALSAQRLAEHADAMQRWAEDVNGPIDLREPPLQPVDAFGGLRVSVSDDAGTGYRWMGSRMGGTGTEPLVVWKFAPSVPLGVTEVRVSIDGDLRYSGPVERDRGP